MTRYSMILIFIALTIAAPANAQIDLSWATIDCGGGASAGGSFDLLGTIGQPDAGHMSGGTFELSGGFWAAAPACPGQRGDANCDGVVDFFDIDPFLSALFNSSQYLAAYCGGSNCAVDIDESGSVDFFDIDPFLVCVFGGCP